KETATRERADVPPAAVEVDLEVTRHFVRWRTRACAAATPIADRESIVGVAPAHAIARLPFGRIEARRFRQSQRLHVPTLQPGLRPGKHRCRFSSRARPAMSAPQSRPGCV